MEILFLVAMLLIIAFSSWRIYIISKKGTIDQAAWAEIRIIGYNTVNELVKLYNVKEDKDEFIDFIIEEISNKVLESGSLTTTDKEFWSKDNLSAIFKPIITQLVDNILVSQSS